MSPVLTKRNWAAIIIFGLFGQFAWTIENMYFNVFLYNTITTDSRALANMIFASAIVATVTTLFMGALTDKLGKRKLFIVSGYILWGLSTMSFSFISVEGIATYLKGFSAVTAATILVIVMDCVMTFFGSTANDAAFNAWINDVTPTNQRGRVETILAVLPLVAMLIIFGGFDWLTQAGKWQLFFLIFGGIIILGGILGIFILDEQPAKPQNKTSYFSNIMYGFKLTNIKENPVLYSALVLLAVLGMSTQIYMPYFIIYMQEYLAFANYTIPLGLILIISSILSVLSGKLIDRIGKLTSLSYILIIGIAGLIGIYFSRNLWLIILFGVLMVAGNMISTACITSIIRDFTPKDRSGHFQGVRMFFGVLFPMATGPYIGAYVIRGSGRVYEELGTVKEIPTPSIFLAAGLVMAILFVIRYLMTNVWNKGDVK